MKRKTSLSYIIIYCDDKGLVVPMGMQREDTPINLQKDVVGVMLGLLSKQWIINSHTWKKWKMEEAEEVEMRRDTFPKAENTFVGWNIKYDQGKNEIWLLVN